MKEERYDAIVIGTGQGGKPLAADLARAGWRTAVVERGHVGGTCVNVGCTPTKTMIASARVAHLARRAGDYGVETGPVTVDLATVRERKRSIVHQFRTGSQQGLEKLKHLDLIIGTARFVGPHRVSVAVRDGGRRTLEAPQIVINTGAQPAIPKIAGLDAIEFLDSTSIMDLNEVPEHLLVIGGGYIGLEFAQMFRRFGSRVTIVQRSDQLLPHEDPDIAAAVQEILQQDGIEVLVDHEAVEVEMRDDRQIELHLRTSGGLKRMATGSHVLVAVGRVPNSEMLELAAAGIDADSAGYIRIDDELRTSAEGVYAIGDVVRGPQFTHISYDDYRILRANLLHGEAQSRANRLVPYTVYIDPQLGGVGLNERHANDRGIAYRVAKMPMSHVARALEVDETRGLMKVLVEEDSERILGASILAIEGGELMSMIQIAMMGELPFSALREGIFAHPTLAESFNNLFSSLGD